MTFLESLVALVLAAIVLLQVARRFSLPYPAMLAAAGVAIALVPGTPTIRIDPGTALALFVSPALLDAAYDFPLGTARRFWVPLVAFAVAAVLVTSLAVALVGHYQAGMPLAAAFAMGAIVSPPDAVAATAVLGSVSVPRNTESVLRGESLFNDATALLLFGTALAIQSGGGLTWQVGVELGIAAPGGLLFGVACGWLARHANPFVSGTLGGTLLQFVNAVLVWIVAERLHLSAVLGEVAFAMTLARSAVVNGSARIRVHSYAVWSTVVFVLNVLAFLLMGMQARTILADLPAERVGDASAFAASVVAAVVVTRLATVVAFNRFAAALSRRRGEPEPATIRQALLVGWSGMRGLVTLAAAFALPPTFPDRDLVVLTAFAVVVATLVLQGLTLVPVIRLLGLDRTEEDARDLAAARGALAEAALRTLDGEGGTDAEGLREGYRADREAGEGRDASARRRGELGLRAIRAQRDELERLRNELGISGDAYLLLQEELDWRELTLVHADERRIEEA